MNKEFERQKIWVELLNEFCPPIYSDGTRQCDLYGGCDRCRYDYDLNRKYALALKEAGLDYSYYAKYLED